MIGSVRFSLVGSVQFTSSVQNSQFGLLQPVRSADDGNEYVGFPLRVLK